jgi:tetratricopeptide (TPR) repeat protein
VISRAKKRLIAACVVVLLAGGIGSALAVHSVMRERTLERALQDGMAAYAAGDYPAAMHHLSVYVGRVKTNPDAILALADCRRQIPQENRKHTLTALTYARAAVQADPQNLKALELVLELCDRLGFSTEALETAGKVLAIDQRHPEALMARVRALARTGKSAEALEAARQMAHLRPESLDAHDAVVQLMQLREENPQAIQQYAAGAVAGREHDVDFALFECRVALSLRDVEGARSAARRAASLAPATRPQLAALVRHLGLLQLHEEAQQVLTAARESSALAAEAVLIQVERLWKNGLLDAAAAEFNTHLDSLGASDEREVALRAIILNTPAEAAAALATLDASTGEDADYWGAVLRGRSALIAGELPQARSELGRAAELNSSWGYAQYFLGRALAASGDWRRAVRAYESALQTDPAWRVARFALIGILTDNGRLAEAREHAAAALSIQRTLPEAVMYARTTVAMLEAGSLLRAAAEDALRGIELLRQQQPDNPSLLALHARGLLATGRSQEATALVERILTLAEPPPLDLLLPLATAIAPHDAPLAERLHSSGVGGTLSGGNLAAYRASTLAASGDQQQARQVLTEAISNTTGAEQLRLQLMLAGLLDRMGDPEAKNLYQRLSDAHPRDVSVQLAVLNSSAAWSELEAIAPALGRLSALAGEDSTQWRIHDSRRLLTFSPGQATAAAVISALTPLLQEDAGNIPAAQLQAQAYLLLEDREHAIETLARTVNAAPGSPVLYPQLIELLHQAGRPQEAIQRLNAFRAIGNLSLIQRRQRAELLQRLGMRAEFAQELRELAARGDEEDRLNLAIERFSAGDIAEAGSLFEQLLQAEPSVRTVMAAADFVTSRDGLEQGLSLLERLPAGTPATDRQRFQALLCIKAGQFAQAEQILRERTSNGDAAAWVDLAQFYVDRGELAQAQEAVARGLALTPRQPQLLWLSGVIKIRSGSSDPSAIEQLSAAAASDQAAPDVAELVEAFRSFGEDSNQERLVSRLQAATRKYPTSYQAWRQLVNVLVTQGEFALAATTAINATQYLPADPRAAQLATETLAASGRLPEARNMTLRWRELAPVDAPAIDALLARLAITEGHFDEAARLLNPWKSSISSRSETAPGDAELLAIALAGSGHTQEALEVLGGMQSDPSWLIRAYRIGEGISRRTDRARAWLRSLEPLHEPTPDLLMAAAQAWYRLSMATAAPEDLQQTIAYARQAADAKPYRGSASAILAAAHHFLGASEEAIQNYRIAVEELPNNAILLNNLAYMLASTPATANEAAALARRAVDLAAAQRMPDSARKDFLETLGVAELRAGRPKEAEQAFEMGLQMDSSAPDLLIGLLEAQIDLRNGQAAQRTIDRIDALPNTQRSAELSDRLTAARARLAALR